MCDKKIKKLNTAPYCRTWYIRVRVHFTYKMWSVERFGSFLRYIRLTQIRISRRVHQPPTVEPSGVLNQYNSQFFAEGQLRRSCTLGMVSARRSCTHQSKTRVKLDPKITRPTYVSPPVELLEPLHCADFNAMRFLTHLISEPSDTPPI